MTAASATEDHSKLAGNVLLGVGILVLVLPARFVQAPLIEGALWLAFVLALYVFRRSTGTLVAVTIVALAHLGLFSIAGLPIVSITFMLALLFIYLGLARPFDQTWGRILEAVRFGRLTTLGVVLIATVLTLGGTFALLEDSRTYWQHITSVTRYWVGFVALGVALGVSRESRLLQFCAVFAVVALVANLIYIPLEVYEKFFVDAYRWHLYPAGIALGYGMLNPNTLGYLFVFASVCALLVTTCMEPGYRYAAVVFWLLSGLVVLLTHSRGAGVAWVVSSIAALLVLGRRHWLLPVGALTLLACAVWALDQKYEIVPGSLGARWSELAHIGDKWKSGSLTARLATVDSVLGDTDSFRASETMSAVDAPVAAIRPRPPVSEPVVEEPVSSPLDPELSTTFSKSERRTSDPTPATVPAPVLAPDRPGSDRRRLRDWLFGVGFGVPLIRAESPAGGVYYRGSHFLLIDLYREVGVLGLAAFIAAFVLVFAGFAFGLRRLTDDVRARDMAFVAGLTAAQLVEQNSSGGMNGPTWLILLFGFLIGRGYRWTWVSMYENGGDNARSRHSFRYRYRP